MRILVTGAGGFVGRRLASAIPARFPDAAIELWDAGSTDAGRRAVDITDASAVEEAVGRFGPSHVVHLAGLASVEQARDWAAMNWQVNFGGTLNLAAALGRHAGECRFVFASSAEVYGERFRAGRVDEGTPLLPRNAYSRAKAAAEGMLRDVLPDAGVSVLRLFNHSGAGQDRRFVIPAFAAQIAAISAGRAPACIATGNLDVERDFMHVDDAVGAYLAVLEEPARGGAYDVFNVGAGRVVTIRSLLDMLMKIAGVEAEIHSDASRVRADEITATRASTDAFRARYGWRPQRSIEDILRDVLAAERAAIEETREQ